jgi:hypothetical protein
MTMEPVLTIMEPAVMELGAGSALRSILVEHEQADPGLG